MAVDRTIDYVELPARDLDAVQAFYESAFGWCFTAYGLDYLAFHDGRMNGGLYRADAQSTMASGGALIILYAVDLAKSRERVLAFGGTLMEEEFSFPGGRRFHFADPNGNELAVWTDQ